MNRNGRSPETVTASDIASFVYCPEQFRLERGLKLPPANQAVLAEGREFHTDLAEAYVVVESSRWPRILGGVLIALALLALLWGLLR
jgi:hypothetical protein